MFLNVIGIVIAFSTVMLLLSLIVSALGQATQATLRLRGRNLKHGLALVLDSELHDKTKSRELAAEVLNDEEISPFDKVDNPNSRTARLLGPAVTWLQPDTLEDVLSKHNTEAEAQGVAAAETVVDRFKKVEKPMSERFTWLMRAVTIFWSLVIAVVFQVSTPQLIQDLSVNPELRAQYMAITPQVLAQAEDTLTMIEEYQPIYERALQVMAERHPDLADAFASVNTATPYLGDISEELSDILDGAENQDEILAELEDILYADVRRHRDAMLESALRSKEYLSLVDITPFRYGTKFYFHGGRVEWANWIGVLVTLILIMLGAPFWFNTLKTAVNFRDIFAPSRQRDTTDEAGGNTSSGEKS